MGTFEFFLIYQTVHPYIALTICLTGLPINILFIVVLLQRSMRSITNMILVSIATADLCLMATYTAKTITDLVGSACIPQSYTRALFFLLLANISITLYGISTWFTIVLALVRYRIVRSDTRQDMRCRVALLRILIFTVPAIIIICAPIYVSQGVRMVTLPMECGRDTTSNTTIEYLVAESSFSAEHNSIPLTLALWTNSIIMKLLPCLLLTVFIGLLLFGMRRHRRNMRTLINHTQLHTNLRLQLTATVNQSNTTITTTARPPQQRTNQLRSHRMNKLLICILAVFLLCQLPQGIINGIGALLGPNFIVANELGEISDDLSLISSSVNFFLYCSMSTQFRNTFFQIFCNTIDHDEN